MIDVMQEREEEDRDFGRANTHFRRKAQKGSRLDNISAEYSEQSMQNLADNNSEDEQEYDEDVSVFEVSPRGNFVVSVVQNEMLSLKYLPRGDLECFSQLMTASYLANSMQSAEAAESEEEVPKQEAKERDQKFSRQKTKNRLSLTQKIGFNLSSLISKKAK